MKTLEEIYLDYAEEAKTKGDMFGHSFWLKRAFEASCLEEYVK